MSPVYPGNPIGPAKNILPVAGSVDLNGVKPAVAPIHVDMFKSGQFPAAPTQVLTVSIQKANPQCCGHADAAVIRA